jgi:hypothetical protein
MQLRGGVHEVLRRDAFREGAEDGGQCGADLITVAPQRLLALLCRRNQRFRFTAQDVRFQPVV